ncbi:hypothetical protein ACHAW5_009961 [Stephanodiscus triporus]|uniref:Secreted protein n=1 Tax=Stephanodiscus triporus TaxID=2934178 RepID=A0ABD3P6Z6_9STRA
MTKAFIAIAALILQLAAVLAIPGKTVKSNIFAKSSKAKSGKSVHHVELSMPMTMTDPDLSLSMFSESGGAKSGKYVHHVELSMHAMMPKSGKSKSGKLFKSSKGHAEEVIMTDALELSLSMMTTKASKTMFGKSNNSDPGVLHSPLAVVDAKAQKLSAKAAKSTKMSKKMMRKFNIF